MSGDSSNQQFTARMKNSASNGSMASMLTFGQLGNDNIEIVVNNLENERVLEKN